MPSASSQPTQKGKNFFLIPSFITSKQTITAATLPLKYHKNMKESICQYIYTVYNIYVELKNNWTHCFEIF